MNSHILFCSFVFILIPILFSCGLFIQRSAPSPGSYGEKYQTGYFKIIEDNYKVKKQPYNLLRGLLRDSTGKLISEYQITGNCSCITKSYNNPKRIYLKLTAQLIFEIPISEQDKFIFKKFAEYPGIEKYCSRSLLDSAKGFERIHKK